MLLIHIIQNKTIHFWTLSTQTGTARKLFGEAEV